MRGTEDAFLYLVALILKNLNPTLRPLKSKLPGEV
jgi:hypothetical protein